MKFIFLLLSLITSSIHAFEAVYEGKIPAEIKIIIQSLKNVQNQQALLEAEILLNNIEESIRPIEESELTLILKSEIYKSIISYPLKDYNFRWPSEDEVKKILSDLPNKGLHHFARWVLHAFLMDYNKNKYTPTQNNYTKNQKIISNWISFYSSLPTDDYNKEMLKVLYFTLENMNNSLKLYTYSNNKETIKKPLFTIKLVNPENRDKLVKERSGPDFDEIDIIVSEEKECNNLVCLIESAEKCQPEKISKTISHPDFEELKANLSFQIEGKEEDLCKLKIEVLDISKTQIPEAMQSNKNLLERYKKLLDEKYQIWTQVKNSKYMCKQLSGDMVSVLATWQSGKLDLFKLPKSCKEIIEIN